MNAPSQMTNKDFERNVYCILGLPFDAVDLGSAKLKIQTAAADRSPCFISTPNLNFLIACQTDVAFRHAVLNSDLCIADGMPLVWIARLLRMPIRERVAGSDLFELLRKDASPRLSVYFFGGVAGAAEAACRALNKNPRGLICVGYEAAGFGTIEAISQDASIERINRSAADFVVVALGAKKGQAWIEHNRARIAAPIISHLGAVVNFMAGTIRRAPRWMQRSGLEWLWRIVQEPGLWRRYYHDLIALVRLLLTRVLPYALYIRTHPASPGDLASASVEIIEGGQVTIIRCEGRWLAQNMDRLRLSIQQAIARSCDIELQLMQTTQIDNAFIGLVMLLYKHQLKFGRRLLLTGMSPQVDAIFRWNGASYLYRLP